MHANGYNAISQKESIIMILIMIYNVILLDAHEHMPSYLLHILQIVFLLSVVPMLVTSTQKWKSSNYKNIFILSLLCEHVATLNMNRNGKYFVLKPLAAI